MVQMLTQADGAGVGATVLAVPNNLFEVVGAGAAHFDL